MNLPDHYSDDLLRFFQGRPDRLALYQALFHRLDAAFPQAQVKVQKSQISFYDGRLFAMVSLPRRKGDPGLLVSFGLGYRLASTRAALAVEPYPNRWTHHVPVTEEEQLDQELLGWLEEAWTFSQIK